MTDKQKIKAEVERLKEENSIGLSEYEAGFCNGVGETCEQLLSFINSLPEEPASEDLEKEIKRYINEEVIVTSENVVISKHHEFHNFYVENLVDVARHFANWQKKQMMNEIWHKGSDNPGNKHPYPVINPDTQEMAFAYYDQRFGLWEFDRDYNPGSNMLWLDIEKIIPNLQEGGAQ